MADALWELVYDHPELADLDPDGRRDALRRLFSQHLPPDVVDEQVRRCSRTIDGFGPLTDLLDDDSISDILVNGPSEVWIERDGVLEPTALVFEQGELEALVDRVVGAAGERVDRLRPVADIALPLGDRFHVVLPPVARPGPLISIRKFPRQGLSLERLVELGAMTVAQRAELEGLVAKRASIVISGATGSGKTTLLGALLSAVPMSERVVVIEETRELHFSHAHAVRLATRVSNVEGRGEVELDQLVRSALRMRPDRIVVGEVRGTEAGAALWAMSTGHRGSMLTVHASGASAAPAALATLAARGSNESAVALTERFEEQLDVRLHMERIGDRRVMTDLRISS